MWWRVECLQTPTEVQRKLDILFTAGFVDGFHWDLRAAFSHAYAMTSRNNISSMHLFCLFISFSAINDSSLSIQCPIYVAPVISMRRMWTKTIIPVHVQRVIHLEPFGCLPLVSTCICLFNEVRRLLPTGLLNGHLLFMPVSLPPAARRPRPPSPPRAPGHMTSARMKSDTRPGKRRANWWNWLSGRCVLWSGAQCLFVHA